MPSEMQETSLKIKIIYIEFVLNYFVIFTSERL